jgi:catechol 2,3-dioxygenase-like lactoylglutathione lyase family enzyme
MVMQRPVLGGISPCFIVSNVVQTMTFYCDKLGFETRFQEPAEDPFFAIVGRNGTQIFLKAEGGVQPVPNHTRHRFMRLDAFIYVQEPDALVAEFASRGVAFSVPLQDTNDDLRGFEIRDPDGYTLFFGRPIADATS